MREGFYRVEYQGAADSGAALLILSKGVLSGVDFAGGVYDGTYQLNETGDMFGVEATVLLPGGAPTVFGLHAPPAGLSIRMTTSLPPDPQGWKTSVQTEVGDVAVEIRRLRDLPHG